MQGQFNPMQIIQAIKQGQNPQQVTMNIVKECIGQTPMGQNLINLAENNKGQKIEQIARNMCQQRGVDFDKEFAAFRKMLGM